MATFTKADLITRFAEQDEVASKASAKRLIDSLFDTIKGEIKAGNDVSLAGFINMKPAVKVAGTARVPGTDRTVNVPQKNVVRFKATAPFKAYINA